MRKLHVITRTAGRPNFFKVCHSSITQQTYPHINHIVIVDDADTDEARQAQVPWHAGNQYVDDYTDIEKINVKFNDYGHFEPFLNAAIDTIPDEDYFCILDDDDFYTHPGALSQAMESIGNYDILFWKVRAAGGIVPSRGFFRNNLPYGQISMIGWIVKKAFIGNHRFKPMYGGDHAFIADITNNNVRTSNIGWVDLLLSTTNSSRPQGEGHCRDILLEHAITGFKAGSTGYNYDIV